MPEMAPDRVLLGQQACLLNVDLGETCNMSME